MKKFLFAIMAVALLIFGVIVFINDDFTHIEDTNGADNYTLQTITDKDIIKREMSSMGAGEQTSAFSMYTTCLSKKFSGVYVIYTENYLFASNLTFTVNDIKVTKGNFKLALVVNDEIVHEFNFNEPSQTYTFDTIKGTVSLVIAGESAAYSFDYDIY